MSHNIQHLLSGNLREKEATPFVEGFKKPPFSLYPNLTQRVEAFPLNKDKSNEIDIGVDLIEYDWELKAGKDTFSIGLSDIQESLTDLDFSSLNDISCQEFAFEPANEYEALNHIHGPSQLRTSSADQCTAETILLRHKALIEHGQGLESSCQEHSISQHHELFKLIAFNKPFLTRPNDISTFGILYDENKFKYARLLKRISLSDMIDLTQEKTVKDLKACELFCRYHALIGYRDSFLKPLKEVTDQIDELDDKQEITKKLQQEGKESTNYITKLSKAAYNKLEKKLESLNKCSFYYIKSCLEDLYFLVKEQRSQKEKICDNSEDIMDLANKISQSIGEAIKNYKNHFNSSDIFSKELKLRLEKFMSSLSEHQNDPWALWKELTICYYSFVSDLKLFLTGKLSYGFEDQTKTFVNTLLGHPASFLMSKKALFQVNWILLETLKAVYQEYNEKWRMIPQPMISDFDFNVISANLCVFFQAENRFMKKNFFMLVPAFVNNGQNSSNVKLINQDSEKTQLDRIFKKMTKKLPKQITFIKQELEQNKLKITAINEIGIDFYFTQSNKKLFSHIESTFGKDMLSKIEETFRQNINENLTSQSASKNCNLYYTVRNKDDDLENQKFEEQIFMKAPVTDIHQTSTASPSENQEGTKLKESDSLDCWVISDDEDNDNDDKSNQSATNNFTQREISFFDYNFLERLILKKTPSDPYFMPRTYLVSNIKPTSMSLAQKNFVNIVNKIDDLKNKMNNVTYIIICHK